MPADANQTEKGRERIKSQTMFHQVTKLDWTYKLHYVNVIWQYRANVIPHPPIFPSLILHQHLDFSPPPPPPSISCSAGLDERREDDNPWFFFPGNTHTGLSRTISDATQALQEKPISSRLSTILRGGGKKRSKRFLYLFPTFRGRYIGGWESRRLFRLFS